MQHRNLLKNQNAKQKLQNITREHPSCKINIQKYMCVFQIASERPFSLTSQPRILMCIFHKCFPLLDNKSSLVWTLKYTIFKLDFSLCLVSGKTVWLSSEREIPAESQITQFPLFSFWWYHNFTCTLCFCFLLCWVFPICILVSLTFCQLDDRHRE